MGGETFESDDAIGGDAFDGDEVRASSNGIGIGTIGGASGGDSGGCSGSAIDGGGGEEDGSVVSKGATGCSDSAIDGGGGEEDGSSVSKGTTGCKGALVGTSRAATTTLLMCGGASRFSDLLSSEIVVDTVEL